MNKKIMIVGVILFLAGIVLILAAPNIGIVMADHAIQSRDGALDSDTYYYIMKSSALSCQMAGAVCSLAGGIGAALSGNKEA